MALKHHSLCYIVTFVWLTHYFCHLLHTETRFRLNHWCLMTYIDVIEQDQHWFPHWLPTWRCQAIDCLADLLYNKWHPWEQIICPQSRIWHKCQSDMMLQLRIKCPWNTIFCVPFVNKFSRLYALNVFRHHFFFDNLCIRSNQHVEARWCTYASLTF